MEYKKPGQLYFRNEELLLYFDRNIDACFVSKIYDTSFNELFKSLGIVDSVRVVKKIPENDKYIVIHKPNKGTENDKHKRGLNGFDPDIEVDGLEYALTHPTIEKSAFVWNRIAIANTDYICGVVESSTRKKFENSKREKQTSQKFGRLLIDTRWLPDRQGTFHKPGKLEPDDLPDSFTRNEKLIDQLEMQKDDVAKLAKKVGISQDTLGLARKLESQPPEVRKKIELLLQKQDRKQPEFPQGSSADPERRQERLAQQINEAPEKKYGRRNRSVRTTKETIDSDLWLRNKYTNSAGQMICQICKKEMPFRKRDSEYYFDAVEALSRDHFTREHEAQFLALCPLCAAKYKEFVKHDEEVMESLKNALMNSKDAEVSLQLGELEMNIRFVESHWRDIRTILQEMG
ncbi:MAG: hypothetical protein C4B58_01345 [Deltaproteobacteria bacterium]|nr:MAG: hypothetical protein C4B58_01345 [Deltaproteobacteria bacterium]